MNYNKNFLRSVKTVHTFRKPQILLSASTSQTCYTQIRDRHCLHDTVTIEIPIQIKIATKDSTTAISEQVTNNTLCWVQLGGNLFSLCQLSSFRIVTIIMIKNELYFPGLHAFRSTETSDHSR